jgi:NAD(P)-dependent dehydrogenase (short-subunit alcohol dehydrogenase family)
MRTAVDSKAIATNPDFHAEAIRLDVSLPDSVQHATARTVEIFGRIDYCVNGAGVSLNLKYFLPVRMVITTI